MYGFSFNKNLIYTYEKILCAHLVETMQTFITALNHSNITYINS